IAPFATDVATNIVSLANIRWDESLNISALCCARGNAFFPPVESHSGSALSADCRWRGAIAVHPDHVVPFALGRRTCRALRSKASTCRWPGHYSRWLFALPAAGSRRQLLDKFFSAGGRAGIRHGHYCGTAHDNRDELDLATARR